MYYKRLTKDHLELEKGIFKVFKMYKSTFTRPLLYIKPVQSIWFNLFQVYLIESKTYFELRIVDCMKEPGFYINELIRLYHQRLHSKAG